MHNKKVIVLAVIRKLVRNYCVLSFFPGIFIVTPRKSQVVVFQHAKSKKYHLGIENSKISGHSRGDSYSEFRIRVQENRR